MGIGAYTCALLVVKGGLNFWLAFPLGGIAAGVFAAVIGFPTLRIKGLFFMIITMGMNEIVRLGLNSWIGLTGGPSGITDIPPVSPFLGIAFTDRTHYYYFILILAVLTLVFIYRLWYSRFGKICRAIAENDSLCQSIGINIMKYKIYIFCICCFLAGLAGGFFAHYYQFISPAEFTIWNSIYALVYLQVGGVAALVGPVIGAIFLTWVTELFRFAEIYKPILFGGIIIIFMMLIPDGLMGIPARLAPILRRLRGTR